MIEEYLAHSARDGHPPQSYAEHILAIIKLIKYFTDEIMPYCKKEAAQMLLYITILSGLHHDLGKLDIKNQVELHKKGRKARYLPVNHVDAGVAYLKQKGQNAICAILLVYSHHHGLPDIMEQENRTESACYRDDRERVRNYVDQELEQLVQIHRNIISECETCIHRQLIAESETHLQEYYEGDFAVFIRIMYSCLVDADHYDTARTYGKAPKLEDIPKLQPKQRLEKLNHYIEELLHDKISADERETIDVMAELLNHAVTRGARRIFVLQPDANMVTQAVEICRKALVFTGEKAEAVIAQVHYRADFEDEEVRYLTALYKAPIIFTTVATFFETIASNRPSTLRRLHDLPGSIIYMKEAYVSLPIKLCSLAYRWMKILEEEWSCHWILDSGTSDYFCWIIESLENKGKYKMKMQTLSLKAGKKNLPQLHFENRPQSREELVDWIMAEQGPRLLIMNTIQSAAVLADDISRKYGRECVEHISMALSPQDHENTRKAIKERLANPEDTDWVLVTTSYVTGLDFPFHVVYRELASVLSLLQIAERIAQNEIAGDTQVWSFSMQDDIRLARNQNIEVSAQILEEYFQNKKENILEHGAEIIRNELHKDGKQKEMKALLEDEMSFQFKTVNDKFRVMEDDIVPVIVDSNLAEQVRQNHGNWREIQKHSVPIPKRNLKTWQVKQIAAEVYQWTLPYDSFLGYMAGVLDKQN